MLEEKEGDSTYAGALRTITELVQVREDVLRIQRTKTELKELNEQLGVQASLIESAINENIQSLLTELEADVNTLYKKIQAALLKIPLRQFVYY